MCAANQILQFRGRLTDFPILRLHPQLRAEGISEGKDDILKEELEFGCLTRLLGDHKARNKRLISSYICTTHSIWGKRLPLP